MQNLSIKLALFLSYALFAILLNSVGSIILQVQMTYGVTESGAAILEAFKDLSIAVTSFIAASFVIRIGYRNSILLALIAVGIASFLMPIIPAFWMNKFMFAVTGASFALVKVSTYAALGLITENRKQHVSLMSFIESFFMVGILASYFLFSLFVDDQNPQSISWLNAYWVLAAASLLCIFALVLARLNEASVRENNSDTSPRDDFLDMIKLSAKPLVILFVISAFLYTLIEQGIMTWLPTFNSSVLNMSPSLSIQMASILALSFAVGRFLAGFVFRWVDWFPVLIACLVLAAILVLVAMPLAQSVGYQQINSWLEAPLAAYLFPLIGVFLAPIYPAIASTILSALPKQKHAAMSGLIVIFAALGGTTGSIITGNLFEYLGGATAFYFSLLPVGLMFFALFFFRRIAQGNGNQEMDFVVDHKV